MTLVCTEGLRAEKDYGGLTRPAHVLLDVEYMRRAKRKFSFSA